MGRVRTVFRDIGYALKTPIGLAASIVYVLLLIAVIIGFWRGMHATHPQTPTEVVADLSMNGLSILVSTILLAPLTAFFVDASREARLKPTKAALFNAIARQFDQIAQRHLHFSAMLSLQMNVLSSGLQIQAIDDAMDRFGRAAARIAADLNHAPVDPQPDDRPTLTAVAIQQSEGIRKSALEHADAIFRDLEQIDNALLFCIPVFDPASITTLSNLRETVVKFRAAMLDFRSVLHGNPDPSTAIRARMAVLDFQSIDRNLRMVAKEIGEPYPAAGLGDDIARMVEIGVAKPAKFIEDIVDILELVRAQDQNQAA
jgi:hypothetical protein